MTSAAELADQATAAILGRPGRAPAAASWSTPRPAPASRPWSCAPRAELAGAGEPVMVVAQTNEQVDDLTDRLAAAGPACRSAGSPRSDYTPSARVAAHPNVTVATKLGRPGRTARWCSAPRTSGPRSARTRPGRGRSSTRPTRCARTCCCAWPACSTAPCSSATPASSTRSPPCRPSAGPA